MEADKKTPINRHTSEKCMFLFLDVREIINI